MRWVCFAVFSDLSLLLHHRCQNLQASRCIPHPFSLALLALALATSSLCSLVLSPHPYLSLSAHSLSLSVVLSRFALTLSLSLSQPSYLPRCPVVLCRQYGSSPYHLLSSIPLSRFLAFLRSLITSRCLALCSLSLLLAGSLLMLSR